jgi:hypothetical protein
VEITVAFADLFDVITISGRSYVSTLILKPNNKVSYGCEMSDGLPYWAI